ncbi:MAG: hypothetical protein E2O79_06470 [Caldithrix sp.]|nr:MAG: hypothetical protein E2O79_06470 [Caldithrix sp.]
MSLPKTFRTALYTGEKSIEITETSIPEPADDEVVVKVLRAGICGSDLHSYRGQSLRGRFEEWKKLGFADGHELCGNIVAKGKSVTNFYVDDSITCEAVWHCGECQMCQSGNYHICLKRTDLAWKGHGAFAEYAVLPVSSVYKLPHELNPVKGVLVEPLAAAYHAVQETGGCLGKEVLVIGGGTIGLLAARVVVVAGANNVGTIVRYQSQADISDEFGVNITSFDKYPTFETLMQNTAFFGFDVVIETTGSESGLESAIRLSRKGAVVVLVGGYPDKTTVNLAPVVGKELKIKGSLCYGWNGIQRDFDAAIEFIKSGKVDVEKIVTHTFPFNEIKKAFETANDKTSGAVKVHIEYEG